MPRTQAHVIASRANLKKGRRQAKQAVANRRSLPQKVTDAIRFVVSVIVSGVSYACARLLFLTNAILVPGHDKFYKLQQRVGKALNRLARASVDWHKARLREHSTLAIDGSWDHRRKGTLCVVIFMNAATKKIVDYEIVEQPKQNVAGNSTESSTNLEKTGVMRIIARWKGNRKVDQYVHDDDGRTRKAMTDAGWNIVELIDPGHAGKSMKKRVEKFSDDNKINKKKLLTGILPLVQNWLVGLMYSTEDAGIKEAKWLNTCRHFCDDHTGCHHKRKEETTVSPWTFKGDARARELFEDFLKDTKSILTRVN
jgi:hypothetical protein